MFYIIFGLGIIIGNYLKGIIIVVLHTPGMQYNEIIKLQLYANTIYALGFIAAFFIIRAISLKTRLPKKISGFPVLVVGVWIFIISIILELSSRLIPYAVYLIAKYPVTKIFISSSLPRMISGILILLGLFIVFLAANPNKGIVKDD